MCQERVLYDRRSPIRLTMTTKSLDTSSMMLFQLYVGLAAKKKLLPILDRPLPSTVSSSRISSPKIAMLSELDGNRTSDLPFIDGVPIAHLNVQRVVACAAEVFVCLSETYRL